MADLKFKYGTTNIDGVGNDPGTIYVQRIGDGKAKMYIDNPTVTGADRLQIGGDIYIGDPGDEEAKEYQAVINPNGSIIDNIVTSAENGGYIIRVVTTNNPDQYDPSLENFSRNTIVLVVQQ